MQEQQPRVFAAAHTQGREEGRQDAECSFSAQLQQLQKVQLCLEETLQQERSEKSSLLEEKEAAKEKTTQLTEALVSIL